MDFFNTRQDQRQVTGLELVHFCLCPPGIDFSVFLTAGLSFPDLLSCEKFGLEVCLVLWFDDTGLGDSNESLCCIVDNMLDTNAWNLMNSRKFSHSETIFSIQARSSGCWPSRLARRTQRRRMRRWHPRASLEDPGRKAVWYSPSAAVCQQADDLAWMEKPVSEWENLGKLSWVHQDIIDSLSEFDIELLKIEDVISGV